MFGPLSLLVVGIWIAQLIFAASILLLLALILRQSPLPFLRATGPIYATAAATCSRSEEHTSELQSLMRISYAVFCLKKKKLPKLNTIYHYQVHPLQLTYLVRYRLHHSYTQATLKNIETLYH